MVGDGADLVVRRVAVSRYQLAGQVAQIVASLTHARSRLLSDRNARLRPDLLATEQMVAATRHLDTGGITGNGSLLPVGIVLPEARDGAHDLYLQPVQVGEARCFQHLRDAM